MNQFGLHYLYSKETALIKIPNDLHIAVESGLLSILILSGEFDTISHCILLNCPFSTGIILASLEGFYSNVSVHTAQNFNFPTPPQARQVCPRALS